MHNGLYVLMVGLTNGIQWIWKFIIDNLHGLVIKKIPFSQI
jgi:hypothetical protein